MKTLIQILIFPALLAILIFALFSQTGELLEEPTMEERILGVTHQRSIADDNQKLLFFSKKIVSDKI